VCRKVGCGGEGGGGVCVREVKMLEIAECLEARGKVGASFRTDGIFPAGRRLSPISSLKHVKRQIIIIIIIIMIIIK
jgi:hypothetical protein